MGIRIYTEKVKVSGSKFEEYAIFSKISDQWFIKHLRFIDPITDDDGTIFPYVRKDHILFIAGLAVSVKSLANFLEEVEEQSYVDDGPHFYVGSDESSPLRRLIDALSKIDVISIWREYSNRILIHPNDTNANAEWAEFYKLIVNVGYDDKIIDFEDEIVDF